MENRINLLNQNEASEITQQLLGQVQEKFGSIPNVFRMMANSPAVLKSYLAFSESLSQGKLCSNIQERIALMIAQENSCEYCLAAHSAIAKNAGLSEEEITKARQIKSENQKAQAALSFAKSIFLYSGEVQDSELEAVRQAGFSEEEILEIVAAVSLNVLTNSLNNVAQTKLDFPRAKELAGCCCGCS